MAQYAVPITEGKNAVPLRSPRPVMALVATGIAAISLGMSAVAASADQVRQSEYWLGTLHVTSAWTVSKGSGITVAVLSDGVSSRQPDLAGSVTTAPAPADAPVASGSYFGDQGTAIASLIAGHGHGQGGNSGVIGVAPRARILSVPVTLPASDPKLSLTSVAAAIPAAIAAGIRYAVNHGAGVIDLPIDPGQSGPTGTGGATAAAGGDAAEQSAIGYALRHDVVLVAPAGDDGTAADAPNYPAAYRGVIAVGAFDKAFERAAWSNHHSYVTLTAAGAGVIAATGSGYQTINSTSAASAIVSGVAALIRARYPQLTAAQVRTALTSSTMYRRPGGLASGFGYGAVNAGNALTAAGQLATSAAGLSGAGALPRQLPAVSLASSGPKSVGAQIARAGEISAGVLVLLLLLIAGYAALGRRRRSEALVASGWTQRQAQSRYPTASAADDPMLDAFPAHVARPERAASQPGGAPRPYAGPFAPAAGLQVAPGASRPRLPPAPIRPPRAGGGMAWPAESGTAITAGPAGRASAAEAGAANVTGPARASAAGFAAAARTARLSGPGGPSGRPGPAGPADQGSRQFPAARAADDGSWQSHGPASRAISRRQPISGTPPWEPAATPSSDLPWTAASNDQAWLPAPADESRRPPAAGQAGPAQHSAPAQMGQPNWAPAAGRPGWAPADRESPAATSPDSAQSALPAGPGQLRAAGSGLPVRQPGANVPRPLSPSGSLWDPVENRRADQQNDDQDAGGRAIYVWSPEPGADE